MCSSAIRGLALAFAGLWAGCAGGAARAPSERAALRPTDTFSTSASGPSVSGEVGNDALHSIVQWAAQAAGTTLVGDARLAALAQAGTTDPWSVEQLGLVDVAPELHELGASSLEALAETLRAQLPALLAGARFTHYGAHLALAAEGPTLSVVLSARPLALEAVPRRVEPGRRLRLRGTLAGCRDAEVAGLDPAGARSVFTAGAGERFDVQVHLTQPGAHRIEVVAQCGAGRQLVATLRLHVGVEPAPPVEPMASARSVASPALQLRVLEELGARRAELGLRPLQAHGVLEALCARYAVEWLDAMRRGRPHHELPDALARARELGLVGGLAQQFVVEAETPDGLASAVLADPAARSSVLLADATHFGLGTVRDATTGRWHAVGVVVQLEQALDLARAPQRLLTLLNAARRARGVAALAPDAQLAAVAGRHAQAFFGPELPSEIETVASANRDLDRVGLSYRRTQSLVTVARALDESATLEPALAAGAEAVGIGVAQGDRPDTGPRRLVVVLILGWPR